MAITWDGVRCFAGVMSSIPIQEYYVHVGVLAGQGTGRKGVVMSSGMCELSTVLFCILMILVSLPEFLTPNSS